MPEKAQNKIVGELQESARDFCQNTSVHGFSYWVSPGRNVHLVNIIYSLFLNALIT